MADGNENKSLDYRRHIEKIAANDAEVVIEKDKQYGASWCRRGGTGAYHVFIRKFDRLEEWASRFHYDIFQAMREDNRPEGLIDDIRDIRGYLLLIEAYAIENGIVGARYSNKQKCLEELDRSGIFCFKEVGHTGCHSGRAPNVTILDKETLIAGDMTDWDTPGTKGGANERG